MPKSISYRYRDVTGQNVEELYQLPLPAGYRKELCRNSPGQRPRACQTSPYPLVYIFYILFLIFRGLPRGGLGREGPRANRWRTDLLFRLKNVPFFGAQKNPLGRTSCHLGANMSVFRAQLGPQNGRKIDGFRGSRANLCCKSRKCRNLYHSRVKTLFLLSPGLQKTIKNR